MTTNVNLSTTDWTPISSGDGTCVVTNNSGRAVRIGIAASGAALAGIEGHLLPPGGTWPFANLAGVDVFAKADVVPTPLTVSAY